MSFRPPRLFREPSWKLVALGIALLPLVTLPGQDLQSVASALRSQDFSAALDLSRRLLTSTPNDPRLWTFQGLALAGLQNSTEALNAYRHALKLSPDYLPALEGEAQLEFKLRSPAAKATLSHILSLQPADAVAHAMYGALSYQEKNCQAAVEHYGQSGPVIRSQPSALEQFGSCLVGLGKAKEAVAVFGQLVQSEPGSGVARYRLAAAQLAAGLPRETLATLATLKGASIPDASIANLSASAYEMLGDTPQAVETLRAATLRNPKDEDLYLKFAEVCLDHRSFDVGIKFLNAGVQAIPSSPRLRVARGILYVQLGDFENAAQDFEAGDRLDPLHSFGSLAQGLSNLQQSKLDQALATTEAEIRKNPKDAFLYYLKAETLRRQGVQPGTPAFEEAVAAAGRAIALQPRFPLAKDVLGDLYAKSGRNDLAIHAFDAALHDDSTDQSALYHLVLLARKTGDTKRIPDLLKRLAEAKQGAQKKEAEANRYRILESSEAR